MEFVVTRFEEQGLAGLEVARTIGQAEAKAMRVPILSARVGRERERAQDPRAGLGVARIGGFEGRRRQPVRRAMPGGINAHRARLGERHIHAQPIAPEATEKVRDLRPRAIEKQPLAVGKNQEIGEPAAMRGEESSENSASRRGQRDIVRDQTLEKGNAIGAGEGDHAAVGKLGTFCHGR